ncbi:UbiD family decarboxylase [Klebsiella pneumoniae subsp. pneumoniae]|nr:UbiD family decarboxylase [Klebsiella pneumoniae subsp. pneumoniae]
MTPNAELAGVYRHIGAGGTVKRPTRIGPAMMFNNIKGYPHSRILVGMHASRQRAALLLGCEASQLALEVGKAVKKTGRAGGRPGQQRPLPGTDLSGRRSGFRFAHPASGAHQHPYRRRPLLLPLGLALASDPDDASLTDVTIHRLCVQGRDELSMFSCRRPPYRSVSPEGRGRRQTAADNHQYGSRSGHLYWRLLRSPYHAVRL